MRDRRSPAQAKALVERYQVSGLSVKAFCAEEFISPVTLYYWRKRLNLLENQEPSMLIPVRLDQSEPERSMEGLKGLELVYPNGVRLSIPMGSDLNTIRELVMLF
jgi:transposase-like protein